MIQTNTLLPASLGLTRSELLSLLESRDHPQDLLKILARAGWSGPAPDQPDPAAPKAVPPFTCGIINAKSGSLPKKGAVGKSRAFPTSFPIS